MISFKGDALVPFSDLVKQPGTCPDSYRRELEPSDETICELQSVVVAMRHRGDAVAELVADIEAYAEQLVHVAALPEPQQPPRHLQLIRLSMALAACAVRYREEIKPCPSNRRRSESST